MLPKTRIIQDIPVALAKFVDPTISTVQIVGKQLIPACGKKISQLKYK